jgi:hypothetical protein
MFFPIFDLKPRQFQEPAAPSGPVDTPAEAAAEAEPLRSPKAEWMVERLWLDDWESCGILGFSMGFSSEDWTPDFQGDLRLRHGGMG